MEKVKLLCSGLKDSLEKKEITLEELYNRIIEKLDIVKDNGSFSLFENHGLTACIEYQGKDLEIISSRATFEENILYYITVKYNEGKNDSFERISLEDSLFYALKIKVKDAVSEIFENIYWQKDTQNEKILTNLYFKVHQIENRFKYLISDYMIRKYGSEWIKTNITYDFNIKSQTNITWTRKSKYTVFKNIKSEILDFRNVDLIKMLKGSCIEGKSVWEREKFDSIFGSDIEFIIDDIAIMRQFIDNSKPICKEVFNDILEVSSGVEHLLNNAEHIINRKLKSKEQKEIIQHIREEKNKDNIEEAYVYEDEFIEEQYIVQELSCTAEMNNFFEEINSFKESIKNQIKEIKEKNKDIFSYINSKEVDESRKKLKILNSIVHFGNDFSGKRFQTYIEMMKDEKGIELMKNELEVLVREKTIKISESIDEINVFRIEDMEEGSIITIKDIMGNVLKLEVENWFAKSMERKEQVFISAEYNNQTIEDIKGIIEVTYLNYDFMHDSVNKPLWPDKITLDLEKLTEYISEFKNKNEEQFKQIMLKLEEVKK